MNENPPETVRHAPQAWLVKKHARHQYSGLEDDDARADEVRLLFLGTDILIDSFGPQLLAIDDRLGQIQLGMLGGISPKTHDELVKLLGILTDAIQELGWYAADLKDIADLEVVHPPGMRPSAQQHFDRHRRRVTRMQENGRNIREQAKDTLSHYSEFVAGRQAQVINALTIVATVFLPLSFLTGYFGMNFATLTGHVQNRAAVYLYKWQNRIRIEGVRGSNPLSSTRNRRL